MANGERIERPIPGKAPAQVGPRGPLVGPPSATHPLAPAGERIAAEQPPAAYQRVLAQREAMGRQLSHRLAVMRKPTAAGAASAGDGAAQADGAAVSQPGEPAEREADAVVDHVADELHGGAQAGAHAAGPRDAQAQGGGASPAAKPAQAAPAIAAKLEPGATIFRAPKNDGSKKRGDHVFNHGLGKALGDMITVANASLSVNAKSLAAAMQPLRAGVSSDAFELTVDKGAGPAAGDANSIAFGNANRTAMTAFNKYVHALEELETTSDSDAAAMTTAHQALEQAGAALGAALQALVQTAFDPDAAAQVPKDQKKLVSTGQAALQALPGQFSAAVAAATTAAKPSHKAASSGPPAQHGK